MTICLNKIVAPSFAILITFLIRKRTLGCWLSLQPLNEKLVILFAMPRGQKKLLETSQTSRLQEVFRLAPYKILFQCSWSQREKFLEANFFVKSETIKLMIDWLISRPGLVTKTNFYSCIQWIYIAKDDIDSLSVL